MVSLRALASLVVSAMFGLAILQSWGGYSDPAVTWVILGLILTSVLFWSTGRQNVPALPQKYLAPAMWVGLLALANGPMWFAKPVLYLAGDWSLAQAARWALWALLLTYAVGLRRPEARWLRHLRFGIIAAVVFFLGVQVVLACPSPLIDVWTVQQEGASILFDGRNPFQDVHLTDTGPRTATDVPYVYPPLHLYFSSLVWKLTGDVRYGSVLALVLLGFAARALAAKTRNGAPLPSVIEDAPALVIWCTPMLTFIIEQGWIDTVQVCWCSALMLAWGRPRAMAVLAGLVLGAKQTMLFIVLPVGLAARFTLRQWLLAGVVALLPLLPWLVWDFAAYKHSNFDFLNALPVRDDALTVVVWAQRRLGVHIPWAVGFAAAALVIGISARRGKQELEPTAITALTAMTFLFAFNKWAFANYYFTLLSLAALAGAAGYREPVKPVSSEPQPP